MIESIAGYQQAQGATNATQAVLARKIYEDKANLSAHFAYHSPAQQACLSYACPSYRYVLTPLLQSTHSHWAATGI
jgi:hypothetical protein